MKKLFAILALSAPLWGQTFNQDYIQFEAGIPASPSRVTCDARGTTGATVRYYFVAAVFRRGTIFPGDPGVVLNSAAVLNGANFVHVQWDAVPGATGYTVIRSAAPAFPATGTCANCTVATATTALAFDDIGGGVGNFASVAWGPARSAELRLDNRNFSEPKLLLAGTPGSPVSSPVGASSRFQIGDVGNRFSDFGAGQSPLQVYAQPSGAAAGSYTSAIHGNMLTALGNGLGGVTGISGNVTVAAGSNLATVYGAQGNVAHAAGTVGVIYGVGGQVSSAFPGGLPTLIYGGDFRAGSLNGAAPGNLIGVRGYTSTATGTVGNDLQLGSYGVAAASVGIIGGASGARGDMVISGTAVMPGPAQTAFGVKGYFDDALGLTIGTNYTAAVAGWISDRNTVGPTAAVMAYLDGGGVRQAAQSPVSAFRVVDANVFANAIHFNYGFDGYWQNAATGTAFKIADIRGMSGETLDNIQAGVWRLKTGTTNIGFQPGIMARAAINAWAAPNGTIVYCSDCIPPIVAGGPTAWATCNGGAGTGALAFMGNGVWQCM